ncbi:hypothetical protein C0J52_06823 [Blattella germanica]|nr:hypothetical protein C0J52_06823 [Blattella germanica]
MKTALHSEKIGVWVAISKSRIIGPLFYDTTVDSDVYIDQIIYPFLSLLNEDEIQRCFFQQDNATPHTSNKSLKVLNELFGERIISKGLWPPRSPDLTPPDYFFWGAAKGNVYKKNKKTIEELKVEITNYVRSVTTQTLEKVFQNMCTRVELCLEQRGKHFQHLLL